MKIIKDVRETFIPDFHSRPKTRTIEDVELGDIRPPTIQDIAKPVDRSQITIVTPKEE